MIRLRPYKKSDSKIICGWLADELTFMKWCAGMYKYPLTEEQLNERFETISATEDAWSMTALDDNGKVCGHFIFRIADYEAGSIRMGFVILAPEMRGRGFGKELMSQALKYACEIVGMKKVTLGVFACNPGAFGCYKSAGFTETSVEKDSFEFNGEKWDCIELEAVSPDCKE